jgi:hypothetical protein
VDFQPGYAFSAPARKLSHDDALPSPESGGFISGAYLTTPSNRDFSEELVGDRARGVIWFCLFSLSVS